MPVPLSSSLELFEVLASLYIAAYSVLEKDSHGLLKHLTLYVCDKPCHLRVESEQAAKALHDAFTETARICTEVFEALSRLNNVLCKIHLSHSRALRPDLESAVKDCKARGIFSPDLDEGVELLELLHAPHQSIIARRASKEETDEAAAAVSKAGASGVAAVAQAVAVTETAEGEAVKAQSAAEQFKAGATSARAAAVKARADAIIAADKAREAAEAARIAEAAAVQAELLATEREAAATREIAKAAETSDHAVLVKALSNVSLRHSMKRGGSLRRSIHGSFKEATVEDKKALFESLDVMLEDD